MYSNILKTLSYLINPILLDWYYYEHINYVEFHIKFVEK